MRETILQINGWMSCLDAPRDTSKATIAKLRAQGIQVAMLTGDNRATAERIAKELGIDTVFAEVLPGQKADKVKELQAQGKLVVMVGSRPQHHRLPDCGGGVLSGIRLDPASRVWRHRHERQLAPRRRQCAAVEIHKIGDCAMSTSKQKKIRVVLADDHGIVRKGIREYLEEDESILVVGEASDGVEAVALVAQERPDVAVFDIQMPRLNGLEATRAVKKDMPDTRVLILTAYDDDPYIFAGLQAGASGYLLKTASPGELVQAVHALMAGESALSPVIAKKLVQRASGTAPREEMIEPLSERELEVLRLAAKGMSNRQIGSALTISDRTVQGHLANIYAKLRVSTRTEAVLFAVREKWVALE